MQNITSLFSSPTGKKSFLVSFEGLEGAGKGLQISTFKNYLEKKGLDVIVLREPGGTFFGEKLRAAILESKATLTPLTEALLFACSRSQLLSETILPALEKEKTVVILDRFIDSSLAYQGSARGLGLSTILSLHSTHPLTTLPHLTFYLSIPWEVSLKRVTERGHALDYFESEGEHFFKKIYQGYEEAMTLFPHRIRRVNGEKSPEKVTQDIIKIWEDFLNG